MRSLRNLRQTVQEANPSGLNEGESRCTLAATTRTVPERLEAIQKVVSSYFELSVFSANICFLKHEYVSYLDC